MSRIVVKNLPKDITEQSLRKIFGQRGTITDVQLKHTSDGKFRQFAFVGFHGEDEGAGAIEFFNNTRFGNRKIVVEPCSQLGDPSKPQAWSKYAKDSSTYKKQHPSEVGVIQKSVKKNVDKKVELLSAYKDDPQFLEFLKLHAPEDAELLSDLIKNDDLEEEKEKIDDVNPEDKLARKNVSNADYLKSLLQNNEQKSGKKVPILNTFVESKTKTKEPLKLFTVKVCNLPSTCKKKDIKDLFRKITPYSIRIPRNIKGIAFAGFKTEKKFKQALLKDRSFVGGNRIAVVEYIDKKKKNETVEDPKCSKWKSQEEGLKNEESIGESGRIFVRNLSYTTSEDDLRNLFSKYGTLSEVIVPIDFLTRKVKGFAIVTFLLPEQAAQAYTELDGTILHGRLLHLLPGKAYETKETVNEDTSNYQNKKKSKQKAQANSSHNWNSLFIDRQALTATVAKATGISEKVILNHEDENAGARLAISEARVVSTIKEYLEDEVVNLDYFANTNTERSQTILLAKNLPAHTNEDEIREMFSSHGLIKRLVFPPYGLLALIEFCEPFEARKAYKSLAYTKFRDTPLFLQWAPVNCLRDVSEIRAKKDNKEEHKDENQDEQDATEELEEDTTLYVKNLNFKTTDQDLHTHFEKCGKICYARVTLKRNVDNPNEKLSTGYGFVRYYRKESSNKALKRLQGSQLDGKTLELKRSERTFQNEIISAANARPRSNKQTGSKILVRNIPFQANEDEIRKLFNEYGKVVNVRLPRKLAPSTRGECATHRGFGFVEFATEKEAKKAFEGLAQSTHLYNRRLVLEWATNEELMGDMRKRTADHFHESETKRSKKSTISLKDI